MKLKNILLIGALACALVVYLCIKNSVYIKWTPPKTSAANEQSVLPQAAQSAPESIQKAGTTESQIKSVVRTWTAKDQAVYADWSTKRGYTAFSGNEYASYDEETLTKLANEGDVKAIETLGDIKYRQGFEAAAPYLAEAALRGSTAALLKMAINDETSNLSRAKDATEKRNVILRALVWCEVAALRGDRWPQISEGNYLLTSNNIFLTEEDKQYISVQAHEMYRKLQERRNGLGLGDFDNSVPPEVTANFDSWERGNAYNRNAP